MANWAGMGARTAKDIIYDYIDVREATTEEVKVYEGKSTWDRATNINANGTFNTSKLNGSIIDSQINSASNWNGAKTLLDSWKSGTTLINGGKIATNTILAQQIAIADYTNLSQINEEKNPNGYTVITNTTDNRKYFRQGTGSWANITLFENPYSEFKFGDEYQVSFSGYKDSGVTSLTAILRYFYTDGTTSNAGTVSVTPSTSISRISRTLKVTASQSAGKSLSHIRLFLEKDGTNGSGYFYVREIEVRKRYAGELIVDGSITANHITSRTITADKLVSRSITANELKAGTITANEIAGRTITADKLVAKSITTNELNVTTLSAISANLGNVTAGSISGVNISGVTIDGSEFKSHYTDANGNNVMLSLTSGGMFFNAYNGVNTEYMYHTYYTPDGIQHDDNNFRPFTIDDHTKIIGDLQAEAGLFTSNLRVGGTLEVGSQTTTIGGSSFANGWLKLGTATNGLTMDNNELYSFGSALIIGTEKGSTHEISFNPGGLSSMFVRTDGVVLPNGIQLGTSNNGQVGAMYYNGTDIRYHSSYGWGNISDIKRLNSSGGSEGMYETGIIHNSVTTAVSNYYIGYKSPTSGWGKLRAGAADAVSSPSMEGLKEAISPMTFSSLDKINQSEIYRWRYKNSEEYNYDGWRYGLVIGRETPVEVLDREGIRTDHLAMISFAWDAIKELSAEVEALKAKLNRY